LTAAPGRLRVRLCETENIFGVDDPTTPTELKQRIVFVDTIVIPAGWHEP
jgi:hypothetical protein